MRRRLATLFAWLATILVAGLSALFAWLRSGA